MESSGARGNGGWEERGNVRGDGCGVFAVGRCKLLRWDGRKPRANWYATSEEMGTQSQREALGRRDLISEGASARGKMLISSRRPSQLESLSLRPPKNHGKLVSGLFCGRASCD